MAHPGADVAVVTGEASIQMCIQELATCRQHDLPIKIMLLNNGYMGMVRQWQEFFYDGRYSHSYVDALPDFVKLAESQGLSGEKVTTGADLEPALKRGIEATRAGTAYVVDVDIARYGPGAESTWHQKFNLADERKRKV